MKNLTWLMIAFTSLILFSCNNDDDSQPQPNNNNNNTIISSNNVIMTLTWSVSGSNTPQSAVDLDLRLDGTNNNGFASSDEINSFESISLNDLPDGNYDVSVANFTFNSNAIYNLSLSDGTNTSNTISGTIGSFSEVEAAQFTKSGNTYILQ